MSFPVKETQKCFRAGVFPDLSCSPHHARPARPLPWAQQPASQAPANEQPMKSRTII